MLKRKNIHSLSLICLGSLLSFSLFFLCGSTTYGANQTFYPQDTTIPIVIDFENGDFEEPDLKKVIPLLSFHTNLGTSPTLAQFWAAGVNGAEWIGVLDKDVLGWEAKPNDPADITNPLSTMIEFRTTASQASSGKQFIDMCGFMNQEFYQVVPTTPGTNIYYSYMGFNNNMILEFSCGEEGSPATIRTDTMTASWKMYNGAVTVPTASTYFGFRCLNGSESYGQVIYNGVTYLNIKRGGVGALLDDIKFQTQSKILIEKSAISYFADEAMFGETITYQLEITNYGQTDTSRTILTDVMGNDVEYAGNVTINGQPAGNLASFNSSTDTLSVYLGTGAGAGIGGSIKGSVAMNSNVGETITVTFDVKVIGNVDDIVQNQAAVSYDDKDFESLSGGGYVDYSNVTALPVVNNQRYEIAITKELVQASASDEIYTFRIDHYDFDQVTLLDSFYTVITVPSGFGSQQILISNLYAGYYQIEETNGNWQYAITSDSSALQSASLDTPFTPAAVTFKNEKSNNLWISGNIAVKNKFKSL